jgi:hypothetical protein
MKSVALVSIAILMGSVASSAQNASYGQAGMEGLSQSQASGTIITSPAGVAVAPGCPVSLRAQHGATGSMVQTDKSRPKGMAQLLHLTLIDEKAESNRIVSARVRVRGLSGVGRVTQSTTGSGKADAVQTLVVRLLAGSDKAVSGDLLVPGMTAVLSIDLNSVIYADGSTRNFAGRESCRVTPDLLMLISKR